MLAQPSPRIPALLLLLLLLASAGCQTDTGWLVHAEERATAPAPQLCRTPLAELARERHQLARDARRLATAPTAPPVPSPLSPPTPAETTSERAEAQTPPDEPVPQRARASGEKRKKRKREVRAEREAPASGAGAGAGACVDLNTASEAELRRLPGVGASRAARIVAERTRRPFTKASQIQRVKGIGKATWQRMADQLCPL